LGITKESGVRKSLIPCIAVFITACAPHHQAIIAVPVTTSKDICIIENPEVNVVILQVFRRTLEKKGYIVQVLPQSSAISDCPTTTTYLAHWWWDLAVYLSSAEINVYKDEKLIGRAVYRARDASLSKLNNAETKFEELVSKLFP